MKGGLYVIYDRVAEESGPCFDAVNRGIALRNFRNLMEKVPGYQKADYRLYQVAHYDARTMKIEAVDPPEEVLYSEETDA